MQYIPERTSYPQEDPSPTDLFSRVQVLSYLARIPLNYRTESERTMTEQLIRRAQLHFAELDKNWEDDCDD